jgi:pimeloyl-ACP methyl ester carboxylesterase
MKCDLGDREIFYETYGTSRPIVMLPGRPSDHRVMLRFMEPLFTQRDGWLRLYPDLPGTGRTPGSDRLATHDQMLDTVLAFIESNRMCCARPSCASGWIGWRNGP